VQSSIFEVSQSIAHCLSVFCLLFRSLHQLKNDDF